MKKRNWWLYCLLAAAATSGLSDFLRKAGAQDAAGPPAVEAPSTAEAAEAGAEAESGRRQADAEAESDSTEEKTGAAARLERFRAKEESYEGKIVVIPIEEDNLVITARFKFMQRTLERAEDERATAVILDMNTPGGLAWESGQLIMDSLPKMTIPTYTYVNPHAVSAGAIIALGTDTIYMAPTSAIGAALAVTGTGADLTETMDKKVKSMIRAQVRSVAKAKGHNIMIAEGFVDDDIEVVVEVGDDQKDQFPMGLLVLAKKGEVLSLDQEQATMIVNGKPLLAKGIAKDLEDLVAQEKLEGELVVATPLGFESFAMWVSRLSFLFIMLGIAGAYMEMQTPGFGIPGAISVISFAIFFFGYYLAGNLAGFEVIAVFVLGMVLIAAEILLVPGTFILGLAGTALLLGSLIYTMAGTSIGGGTFSINVDGLVVALRNLAIGLGGAILLIALALRYLPQTLALNWLILQRTVPEGPSLGAADGRAEAGPVVAATGRGAAAAGLVGRKGVTLTSLRPSGKGRFGGETLDIVSDAEFVESGAEVKIVAHEGSRIVVERA